MAATIRGRARFGRGRDPATDARAYPAESARVKYLLDTNTVSFALRGIGRVGERLLAESPTDVGISSITESELWFGVHRLGSTRLRRAVESFLSAIVVAFSHLLFNISGILVWWPLKVVPLTLATKFAQVATRHKSLAFLYILVVFFLIPILLIVATR